MRKIPTLFVREHNVVTQQVNPGCEWVLAGEGVATRKWDGTCVMVDADGTVWARREVKPGKQAPNHYRPVETDPITGKTVGWEPWNQSGYAKVIAEAVSAMPVELDPGTYELVGPKINGNPDAFSCNMLVRHGGRRIVDLAERSFYGIGQWLTDNPGVEGIVFWRIPGDQGTGMAKIKRRDYEGLS